LFFAPLQNNDKSNWPALHQGMAMRKILIAVVLVCGIVKVSLAQNGSLYLGGVENTQAQAEIAKGNEQAALDHLTTLSANLKAVFQASSDYTLAKDNLAEAQSAYDDARNRVLSNLVNDSKYESAVADRDAAKAAVVAARNDGMTGQDMADVATASMKAGTVVSKLEADALIKDKAFQEAKSMLVAATKAVKDLDSKFQLSLTTNPEIQSAKEAYQKAVADYAATAGIAQAAIDAKNRADSERNAEDARRNRVYNQQQVYGPGAK
jgi:hypothetical protein